MNEFIRFLKRFFNELDDKTRMLFLSTIIGICVVSIITVICILFIYTNPEYREKISIKSESESKKVEMATNFKNIFTSELITDTKYKVEKNDEDKELVYSGYKIQNKKEDYYDINLVIPTINIKGEIAKNINKKIVSDFYDKGISVMKQRKEYIVYNVSYIAYINDGILSIAIKANLKEGDLPERTIIKTYAMDINYNDNFTFERFLSRAHISNSSVQKKIRLEVKSKIDNFKGLFDDLKNRYERDINDDMYKIENIENYLYTDKGNLYIIFPYGNTENTNDMDIVIY